MRNTAVKLKPLSAHAGVEISGVDLREPLSEAQAGEIRAALNQWGVVFFRDQDITPVQQVEFARHFGTVQQRTHPTSMTPVEGAPEVAVIQRSPDDGRNTGGFWHTDQCFLSDPPLGSVLYAKELPTHGGDTMFAHMGGSLRRTVRRFARRAASLARRACAAQLPSHQQHAAMGRDG